MDWKSSTVSNKLYKEYLIDERSGLETNETIWDVIGDAIRVIAAHDCLLQPECSIYSQFFLSGGMWNAFQGHVHGDFRSPELPELLILM